VVFPAHFLLVALLYSPLMVRSHRLLFFGGGEPGCASASGGYRGGSGGGGGGGGIFPVDGDGGISKHTLYALALTVTGWFPLIAMALIVTAEGSGGGGGGFSFSNDRRTVEVAGAAYIVSAAAGLAIFHHVIFAVKTPSDDSQYMQSM
jgi:hypothetical protein